MDPADHRHLPLHNLSKLQSQMTNIHRFLTTNTTITPTQITTISTQITAAIHDVIVNGTALISSPISLPPNQFTKSDPYPIDSIQDFDLGFPKAETLEDEIDPVGQIGQISQIGQMGQSGDDLDIVELDAVELLAEHLHFCDFCGKGFKRDANLRMHMRAHGNRFKTLEALSKPEKLVPDSGELGSVKRTRFSCPFSGCSRNKLHKKFRPLKSVICVKNHFKRSHCPKMYSCNRCHKKSFSVLADLKSHLKHCGETKWKCSCGTSFSRKDKLFGHMALFEGHMPAIPAAEMSPAVVVAVEDGGKGKVVQAQVVAERVEDVKGMGMGSLGWVDDDDNMLFGGLGSIGDDFCLQDLLGGGSLDWDL